MSKEVFRYQLVTLEKKYNPRTNKRDMNHIRTWDNGGRGLSESECMMRRMRLLKRDNMYSIIAVNVVSVPVKEKDNTNNFNTTIKGIDMYKVMNNLY